MSKLRKVFTVSVMLMTVLSMSVVVAPTASAAAGPGDLVKVNGSSAVYYVGNDSRLYVFPNEDVYKSWYSDFSSVVTISATELNDFGAPKANITMRPGTKLIKRPVPTAPEVYAVEPGGVLRWIDSEDTAKTLYGDNWASRVVDVVDSFFTNYQADNAKTNKVTADSYPTGSLVKFGSSPDVYYINSDGKAQRIATEAAFVANRFDWNNVITATIAMPETASEITGQNPGLVDTASGAATVGNVPGTGTGLSVALASDTPEAATVITNTTSSTGNGQALVPFVKLNFTASADGAVKVTNLRLKRVGISSDSDVDSLYLYEGDDLTNALIDGASVSSNYVTFNNSNGLFTVPAGETKTITLRGDLLYSAGAGKTIGFELMSASDVTTNGAAVSGSFPASGNMMTTANATDLGRLSFSGQTAVPSGNNTPIDPDQTDQEVWRVTFQSNEQKLEVDSIKITAIGSIQTDDLSNFKIYSSGELVGSADSMNSDYEVNFDLTSNPLIIEKGSSKSLSFRADVAKGSTRTFYFSIQDQNDVIVKDTSYGVYVQPFTVNSWSPITPTSGNEWLISAGSLSVSKSTDSPTEDVVVDGTNVVLGIWDFRASGEDIKVKNLDVQANVTGGANGGIDNGKVYVNDVQVGTTKDLTEATDVNFTFGSTFIVKAGETAKVKVVGDIKTTTATSYSGGETVAITLGTGADNAQRVSSLGTLNVPASDTVANTLNITAASLSVSKFSGFGVQTVVAGTNNARLGSFVLKAGASEGVNISSITIALSSDESGTVTNMYLKDNSTGTQIGDTKVSPSTSNIMSVNFNIPASGTKVIDIYADVKAGSDAGSWIANVDADGTGSITSNSVSATAADLQTMTIGSGALYSSNGTQPAEAIVLAGTTDNSAAQFSFNASNEGYTINKVVIKTEADFASATAGVTLHYMDKDGASKEATATFIAADAQTYATATFTGLTMYVPKDQTKNLDVTFDTVLMSASGQTSGNKGKIYLDYDNGFQATGDSGTTKTSLSDQTADLSGNNFIIRKSKPTFTQVAVSGNPSSASSLFRFSVVADAKGDIEFKQLGFSFTTSGVTVTDLKLYDENGTAITDSGANVDSNGYVKVLVGGADDSDVQRIGTSAKVYDVKGTVVGWGDSGDSMTVRMLQRTTADVATDLASSVTVTAASGNFIVWSDLSIQGAAHTTVTADWANGYLLKNLDGAQDF